MKPILACLICLQLLLAGAILHAAEVVLVRRAQFEPDYTEKVSRLQPGDRVILNGHSFTLRENLSQGSGNSMSHVWDIGGGRAIRLNQSHIPVNCESLFTTGFEREADVFSSGRDVYSEVAMNYFDIALNLARHDIPVVKVFEQESHPPYFTIVERLDIEFDLVTWYFSEMRLDPERLAEWEQFLDRTQAIREIGDLKMSSVAYVRGRGWVLLDFNAPLVIDPLNEVSVFERLGLGRR